VIEHYDYLYRVALNCTWNEEDARDLVQDTFEKALKSNYCYDKNLKAWLVTILKNIYIDNYRKAKRREDSGYEPELITYNSCSCTFLKDDVLKMVRRLKYKEKKIFLMLVKGFKYEEISENLEIPLGTVKSIIFRIRQKLSNLNEFNRYYTKSFS
jgi:RNA polymerase sigma-70 factor (ECF subfamily)